MKKIFCKLMLGALLTGSLVNAQGDASRITLTPYIAPEVEEVTQASTSLLTNKLNQVLNENGLAGNGMSRFIITANVTVLSKDVLPTAPPSIAYTFDVTLYIGDGIDGNKFTSHNMTLKGVGMNETKAMMEAIKQIRPKDEGLQSFVTQGKSKIVQFYNQRCDLIIKEAKLLESQNRFEEAIFKLTSIPEASLDCYNKALDLLGPLYAKYIDRDCKQKLQDATVIWNANQTVEAANEIAGILSSIDPQASCQKEVKAFSDKVAKRVLQLTDREWNFKVDSEIGLKRDLIKAYRDVGVAYGKGQPNSVVYNVRGWW